jgi:hypothetical protein
VRTVKIKPVAEETLAERFISRLQDLQDQITRFRAKLVAVERDAAAAGFSIEPTSLLLGRLERAVGAQKRTLETHASDPLQFALDLPPTAPARDDREGDRGLDRESPPR